MLCYSCLHHCQHLDKTVVHGAETQAPAAKWSRHAYDAPGDAPLPLHKTTSDRCQCRHRRAAPTAAACLLVSSGPPGRLSLRFSSLRLCPSQLQRTAAAVCGTLFHAAPTSFYADIRAAGCCLRSGSSAEPANPSRIHTSAIHIHPPTLAPSAAVRLLGGGLLQHAQTNGPEVKETAAC